MTMNVIRNCILFWILFDGTMCIHTFPRPFGYHVSADHQKDSLSLSLSIFRIDRSTVKKSPLVFFF